MAQEWFHPQHSCRRVPHLPRLQGDLGQQRPHILHEGPQEARKLLPAGHQQNRFSSPTVTRSQSQPPSFGVALIS
jgi:hypothetical protein